MINRTLLINLTDKTHEVITTGSSVCERFLGGRGMCSYFLAEYLSQNPIIFQIGLFTGTEISGSGRCSVAHISPHTGGLFRSDFGGDFSISLKNAGYDGLIIIGSLTEKQSLIIDKTVTFGTAINDGYSYVTVGTSAWNGTTHAKIICDGRYSTHRGSTGYAMAQKNLESICVRLPHDEKYSELSANEDIERLISASPALTGRVGIGRYGSAALYDLAYGRNILPHNFLGSKPDESKNAHSFLHCNKVENFTCTPCTVGCQKNIARVKLPEYDDFASLTAMNSADLQSFDNIFTDGLDAVTMSHKGSKELTVKGLEIPSIDPRGAYGVALGYATSTNGADYTSAMAHTHEILRKPVPTDRMSFEGKAYLNYISENFKAALDCLSPCSYLMFAVGAEEYAKALSEHTGTAYTAAMLAEAGENIWMNEINIIRRLGFGIESDMLPDVFFTGYNSIDRKAFDAELNRYHRLRGLI